MPRSEKDNQEIRAARRGEILAAATTVFAEKGVARTKVTDIAAAANLSHGLLYHYFPSKEAIFEAIAEEMMQQAEADLGSTHERAIDRLTHTIERARERVEATSVDASRVVMLAVLMRDQLSEDLRGRLNSHLLRLVERTRDTIAQAQAEGDIDDSLSPDELTRVVLFLFRGMTIRVPDYPVALPDPATIVGLLRRPKGARP